MKRHKHLSPQKPTQLILGVALLVVVIIGFFIFKGPSDDAAQVLEGEQDAFVLEEEPNLEDQLAQAEKEEVQAAKEEKKEEAKSVPSKGSLGEDDLCEDYFFEQGDELNIAGHEIIVDRIGKGSLRLRVDNNNYVLNEGDNKYLGDGIRISIAPDDVLYFSGDDADNAVMMRIGCHYDDDPYEKYLESKGTNICKRVYQDCQDRFGIDLDD